ncbi:hypothetical protein QBC35DRAFT_473571 [Podospora australis]|uniref:Uncharacterized protein n=1 Tax=Podospora australis TaxID=1536484 RepID=A0AAN6WVR6_9PEZI|nr:hypothetical protein QBC35DRAFT_473571 [Podospora australis]
MAGHKGKLDRSSTSGRSAGRRALCSPIFSAPSPHYLGYAAVMTLTGRDASRSTTDTPSLLSVLAVKKVQIQTIPILASMSPTLHLHQLCIFPPSFGLQLQSSLDSLFWAKPMRFSSTSHAGSPAILPARESLVREKGDSMVVVKRIYLGGSDRVHILPLPVIVGARETLLSVVLLGQFLRAYFYKHLPSLRRRCTWHECDSSLRSRRLQEGFSARPRLRKEPVGRARFFTPRFIITSLAESFFAPLDFGLVICNAYFMTDIFSAAEPIVPMRRNYLYFLISTRAVFRSGGQSSFGGGKLVNAASEYQAHILNIEWFTKVCRVKVRGIKSCRLGRPEEKLGDWWDSMMEWDETGKELLSNRRNAGTVDENP